MACLQGFLLHSTVSILSGDPYPWKHTYLWSQGLNSLESGSPAYLLSQSLVFGAKLYSNLQPELHPNSLEP